MHLFNCEIDLDRLNSSISTLINLLTVKDVLELQKCGEVNHPGGNRCHQRSKIKEKIVGDCLHGVFFKWQRESYTVDRASTILDLCIAFQASILGATIFNAPIRSSARRSMPEWIFRGFFGMRCGFLIHVFVIIE